LFFQSFQATVKGGLFALVLTAAFDLDFAQNVVSVSVLVEKGFQDNRGYVAADKVAVY